MKKIALQLIFCACCSHTYSQNQSFQHYFKEGAYKFDDTRKILKSEVFTTYLSYFGFTNNNTLTLQAEHAMDSIGTITGRYAQYCNGYKVEAAMMNVLSKYGVVLYVNGFSLPSLNVNVANPVLESNALAVALQQVNAPKYAWQDAALERHIKASIDRQTADSVYDSTKTYYPKGELVIARPWGDTNANDTSKYKLCWKFMITPMHWDTVAIDTNTVDTIAHYDTVAKFILSPNVIVYVNALTAAVYTIDSNTRGGAWETCHQQDTWYHGPQDVTAWRQHWWFFLRYVMDDRNINMENINIPGYQTANSDNWIKSTMGTAYWGMEKAWDYFSEVHGYNKGPNTHKGYMHEYNEQKVYYLCKPPYYHIGGSQMRTSYQSGIGDRDTYYIGMDLESLDVFHRSSANLDVIGHEYTHAMIHGGPDFVDFGENSAIAEAYCDYFGMKAAQHAYGSRYNTEWVEGFGHLTGEFKRYFNNPAADVPFSSEDTYYPPLSTGYGAKYSSSGILRKVFWLSQNGGVHNLVLVPALPAVSGHPGTDWYIFGVMHDLSWKGMNYNDTHDAFWVMYEYYFGKCSPSWISMILAFKAVNIGHPPACAGIWRINEPPRVVRVTRMATDNGAGVNYGTLRKREGNNPKPPVIQLAPGVGSEGVQVKSFSWNIPAALYTSFPNPQDMSALAIDSVSDLASQYISCIVTYADTTLPPDTLTTFVHFVDDDYETIVNNSSSKGGVFPNANVQVADELKIYPNPVNSLLSINLPFAPVVPLEYHILDITGKEMLQGTKKLYNQNNDIMLPVMPSGIYILKIKGNGIDYVRRISVQQ